MTTPTTCYPWWYPSMMGSAAQPWANKIIPSGCSADGTGSIPCAPSSMRASAEAWLRSNAPEVLALLGGVLDQDTYTFARYMHSEVGSGTVTERVAVGEAAVNQAKNRAGALGSWRSKLNGMLIPNGKYGAIHCPAAYCASLGKSADCNCAGRWAATTRDPSVMSLVLANLVVTGASGDFANGAMTQWGPEYLKNTNGTRMGTGTSRARVETFVRYAASSSGGRYFWVGDLPGIDPWHTWLASKKKPLGFTDEMAIQRGIEALALDGSGKPIRPNWPKDMPSCPKQASTFGLVVTTVLSIAAGAYAFKRFTEPT